MPLLGLLNTMLRSEQARKQLLPKDSTALLSLCCHHGLLLFQETEAEEAKKRQDEAEAEAEKAAVCPPAPAPASATPRQLRRLGSVVGTWRNLNMSAAGGAQPEGPDERTQLLELVMGSAWGAAASCTRAVIRARRSAGGSDEAEGSNEVDGESDAEASKAGEAGAAAGGTAHPALPPDTEQLLQRLLPPAQRPKAKVRVAGLALCANLVRVSNAYDPPLG